MLRCEALVPLAVGAQESLKHADGTGQNGTKKQTAQRICYDLWW